MSAKGMERQRLNRRSDVVSTPARRGAVRSPSHTDGMAAKILGMQQVLGNQAVQQMASTCQAFPSACPTGGACHTCPVRVQAKLIVNEPGDIYEQEADRVAERVAESMPFPGVQRKYAWGGQRYLLSTGGRGKGEGSVPLIVYEALRSPGSPLDHETRTFMESRFGHDFSQVRVHTDARAAKSARAVDVLAYTMGRDVVFGAERYTPGTNGGRRLLAHELTHVVQQSGNSILPQLQREEAPVKATSGACSVVDVFSELNPGIVLPSAYFRNGEPVEKDKYKSEMETSKKGNCVTKANFPDVTLRWDLGNPKLGSWYTLNINKDSHTFDINNQLIYSRKSCCACFTGSLGWSINVNGSRVFDKGKKTERTETGKAATPLTGTKKAGKCAGAECCSINKTFPISLWLGDKEVSLDFTGNITLSGSIFENKT